jgi:phosphatidylserine/phosphatidylglycerophosphate/cardiolipin synthase-like enzyme
MWGLGLEEGQEEKSILKAYVELIYNAREYIYIENQFFISV